MHHTLMHGAYMRVLLSTARPRLRNCTKQFGKYFNKIHLNTLNCANAPSPCTWFTRSRSSHHTYIQASPQVSTQETCALLLISASCMTQLSCAYMHMYMHSVCLVTLSLYEVGLGRFSRQSYVTDIYHTCVRAQRRTCKRARVYTHTHTLKYSQCMCTPSLHAHSRTYARSD